MSRESKTTPPAMPPAISRLAVLDNLLPTTTAHPFSPDLLPKNGTSLERSLLLSEEGIYFPFVPSLPGAFLSSSSLCNLLHTGRLLFNCTTV
jgi:hypothetical protein